MRKIKVFEAFAGYGSQSIALSAIGVPYEVVATSDIEPSAIIGYAAIRNKLMPNQATEQDMRALLKSRNIGFNFSKNKSSIDTMKKTKLATLYNAVINTNNLGDISLINPADIPDHDLFTYSSPCQSFSVSGKSEGGEWICRKCGLKINPLENSFREECPVCHCRNINKPTSSLLWECVKVIEQKKPPILMMENVKNILNNKHKPAFEKWCSYLEARGYDNKYTVINAKDYCVPQNRERMIMISVLKDSEWYKSNQFNCFSFPEKMPLKYCIKNVLQPESEVERSFYLPDNIINGFYKQYSKDLNSFSLILKSLPCVVASRGRYTDLGTTKQHYELNRLGLCNTLTTVEKDNYLLAEIQEPNIVDVGSLKTLNMLPYSKMHEQCGRVYGTFGIAPTITTITGGHQEPKIVSCITEKYLESNQVKYFSIRKLTPIECGRLMGVPELFIQRIKDAGLSNSQMYRMFGNSIVTTVLMAIFGQLFQVKDYQKHIIAITDKMYNNTCRKERCYEEHITQ